MKKLAIILLLLLVVLTVCRGQSALESTPLRVSFLGPDGEVLSSVEIEANASDQAARQMALFNKYKVDHVDIATDDDYVKGLMALFNRR